jgi:hypothetical protein
MGLYGVTSTLIIHGSRGPLDSECILSEIAQEIITLWVRIPIGLVQFVS